MGSESDRLLNPPEGAASEEESWGGSCSFVLLCNTTTNTGGGGDKVGRGQSATGWVEIQLDTLTLAGDKVFVNRIRSSNYLCAQIRGEIGDASSPNPCPDRS